MIRAAYNRNSASGAWLYPIPPDASPQTVNWEQFLGPAPKRPFSLERFFRWRCYWDYSGGLATDLFVHLLTWIHFVMDVQAPSRIQGAGGTFVRKATHEVPDTLVGTLTYPEGFTVQLSCTLNSQAGSASGVEILGSKASLRLRGDDVVARRGADRSGRQRLGRALVARGAREGLLRRSGGARPRGPGQPAAGARRRRPALVGRRRGRTRDARPRLPRRGEVADSRSSRTRASAIAPPPPRT